MGISMNDNEKILISSYIFHGLVDDKSNAFLDKLIGLLFSSIDFDKESLNTLQDYKSDGKKVFVSFQTSNVSLLILNNLLRKHNYIPPHLALEYNPYLFQALVDVIRKIGIIFSRLFLKKIYKEISDFHYIDKTLNENKSIALSLLSNENFLWRYLKIKTDPLQYLVEIQKNSAEPIIIYPNIIFWNRNPERTRNLITSKAIGSRGFISALFATLKSATPGFIRIPAPINIQEEIANSTSGDTRFIARSIREKLLEVFNHEKRVVLGPVIKSKQEMMEKILYHKNVLDVINASSSKKKSAETRMRKRAFKYFNEIAADFSIIYIKMFEKALTFLFKKIFDGINYNIEDMKMIREAAQKGPIIVTPAHKSHMDYLIISSVFYREKIIPPHILSGSNLTFFPMGKIFRRSGAFFMRRSFKGNDVYAAVFKQYVKTLISEGYSIEFFIEGGRTRTGKVNLPKMGMLKYLVESIEEGYNTDMVFLPMTINYDRILEEKSYQNEIKGKEKTKETTTDFVKSSKLLKKSYGSVYLSFKPPISYIELKNKFSDSENLLDDISLYLTRRINEAVMVTPFTLVSSAILLSSIKGFTRDGLRGKVSLMLEYLIFMQSNISDDLKAATGVNDLIDRVLESYQHDFIVNELKLDKGRGEGREVLDGVFALNEQDRPRINFYKNNIIHFFLPMAFVAHAILSSPEDMVSREDIKTVFLKLMNLFANEFIYPEIMDDTDAIVDKCLLYCREKSILVVDKDSMRVPDRKHAGLLMYAKVLQDFMESYFIIYKSVSEMQNRMDKKDFIYEARKNGVKMYHVGEIRLVEALSMPNYANAIDSMKRLEIIKEEPVPGKKASIVDVLLTKKARWIRDELKTYIDNIP